MQKYINSWERLEETVRNVGLLPYFKNKIPGFSVEEHVPDNILWDIENGPWEWKGRVLRNLQVAYGKFFWNRAGYISLDLLPDFLRLRRLERPITRNSPEGKVLAVLTEHESLLSHELKELAGYVGPRAPRRSANPFENLEKEEAAKSTRREVTFTDSRFETVMAHLQMSGFVTIADFEYRIDRHGNPYGWGIARYTTPEALYGVGPSTIRREQAFSRLYRQLQPHLPAASPAVISSLLF